jgi:hypothetical protein
MSPPPAHSALIRTMGSPAESGVSWRQVTKAGFEVQCAEEGLLGESDPPDGEETRTSSLRWRYRGDLRSRRRRTWMGSEAVFAGVLIGAGRVERAAFARFASSCFSQMGF